MNYKKPETTAERITELEGMIESNCRQALAMGGSRSLCEERKILREELAALKEDGWIWDAKLAQTFPPLPAFA